MDRYQLFRQSYGWILTVPTVVWIDFNCSDQECFQYMSSAQEITLTQGIFQHCSQEEIELLLGPQLRWIYINRSHSSIRQRQLRPRLRPRLRPFNIRGMKVKAAEEQQADFKSHYDSWNHYQWVGPNYQRPLSFVLNRHHNFMDCRLVENEWLRRKENKLAIVSHF